MENNRLNKLQEFLKSSPDDSFLNFALAKEYESLENYDLALKHFLYIKEKDPSYIGLYYHLGQLYALLQEDILALDVYKQGMSLAKEQGDYHALSELNTAKTNLEITLGN